MRRRTLLSGVTAFGLTRPAIAQPVATLRFIPQANLSVLDPIWTTATVTTNHAYYVFDTLFGATRALQPKPQMAEGHTVSDDGRVWRIRLRDGLWFHDGTPVRGVDCATSLARWAKRDPFGQLLDRVVDDWGAPDDRTVEIRLKRPFPLLLDALAKPEGVPFIMPERFARTDAMTAVREMVGSGPYRFVANEYNSGSRMVYARFDRYAPRQELPDMTSGAKIAHFQRVVWNVIPDPATAAAALQNNEADWWERPLVDLVPTLQRNPNITVQVADPAGRLALARLNHLQPPFNDVKLRRAVLMAVRQDDYMRAARGDDTTLWTACRSLFPKNTPYYHDEGGSLMRGDLDAARTLLREAGYGGQKVVIINPTDFPDIGPLGQVTFDVFKKLGINVDLQESDWGTVVQRRASREPVEKGGWSMFHTTGSAPGYASPATSALVRGQGAKGWFGWWDSARAEALTDEWVDAPDGASQARLAQAIGQLALEEVATIPLGQFYLQTAFRKSITGVLQGTSPYPWGVKPA